MGARPIVEIGDWLDVVWTTFTRGPDAHDLNSQLRSLSQRFRHPRAIVVPIHQGHVRAHESQRPAVYNESSRARLNKAGASAVSPIQDCQENCRARNQSERGEKQTL